MTQVNYKDEELLRLILKLLYTYPTLTIADIISPDECVPESGPYIELTNIDWDNKRIPVQWNGDKPIFEHIKFPEGGDFSKLYDYRAYAIALRYTELSLREINFISSYSQMAKVWSQNSYCVRRRVGALIVKDKMIISDGFNGTPSGFDNCCEIEVPMHSYKSENGHLTIDENDHSKVMLKTRPEVLHAESNAITKCAKYGRSTDGADLYVTCSPCLECSKLIIQAGIKRVRFTELYKDACGLILLLKSGVEIYYDQNLWSDVG